MKAIISSPFIFPPTQLTFAMADELEKIVRGFGWDVVRLSGPQNLRAIFDFAMNKHPDATLIVYMGHASPSAFLGEDIYGIGILGVDNAAETKEHIVVGMPACLSAQQLGHAVVKAGAKAFVGSEEEMYAQWPEAEHNYLADWFDYTLTFFRSLIDSLTGGVGVEDALAKALQDYRDKCTYYMEYYKSNLDTWPNADYYYYSTRQNRDFVVGFIK